MVTKCCCVNHKLYVMVRQNISLPDDYKLMLKIHELQVITISDIISKFDTMRDIGA